MTLRLAVLADIHGNLPALQAVLADMQSFNVSAVLVAGDLIAGPQPNEVIELLRSLDNRFPLPSQSILGNNEIGLLDYLSGTAPQAWQTHKQFALGRWIFANVQPESLEFIQSLPVQAVYQADGLPPVRIVHGSPRDPNERIFPERQPEILDRAFAQIEEDVLVCGHTHLPWSVCRNGKLAVNPGALGCSLNGDPRASYALLTWQEDHWQTTHRAVSYDLKAVEAAFHTSGLLEAGGALARTFLLSMQTGRDFSMKFLDYAFLLAQELGYPPGKYVPDEAWNQAAQTFNWGQRSAF